MPVRAVPICRRPPTSPRRPRAVPPPLPTPAPRRLTLDWQAITAAASVAVVSVCIVLLWAATHPSHPLQVVSVSSSRFVASPERTTQSAVVGPEQVQIAATVKPPPKEQVADVRPVESTAVQQELPRPVAPPPTEALVAEAPVCETLGTSVEFDANPARAARQAARQQKLLLVLHVSGNFEDSGFT